MDKELFLQKYEEVYRDMYRYAFYNLGHREDAEDAVSEAVTDAYKSRASLKEIDAFKGWIFTILKRKCIAKRKDYATKKADSLDESHTDDEGTTLADTLRDETKQTEESTMIRQLFMTLSEEDRQIITLHIFGGYKSKEIGDIMGMNDATVRSREHRALEKLRQELIT